MGYLLDKNYNALDRMDHWDKETGEMIKKRLAEEVGRREKFSFLTEEEGAMLFLLVQTLIFQPEDDQRVKIAEAIDKGLSPGKSGVRFGHNPWRGEFYKQGIAATMEYFKDELKHKFDVKGDYEKLAGLIRKKIGSADDDFLADFFRLVLSDAVEIYYSHPSAWNKIGFPGPAYPEGYAYLDCGEADEWEPKYL